jgi:hypothetical protein
VPVRLTGWKWHELVRCKHGALLLPPFPYGLAAFRRNYVDALITALTRPDAPKS